MTSNAVKKKTRKTPGYFETVLYRDVGSLKKWKVKGANTCSKRLVGDSECERLLCDETLDDSDDDEAILNPAGHNTTPDKNAASHASSRTSPITPSSSSNQTTSTSALLTSPVSETHHAVSNPYIRCLLGIWNRESRPNSQTSPANVAVTAAGSVSSDNCDDGAQNNLEAVLPEQANHTLWPFGDNDVLVIPSDTTDEYDSSDSVTSSQSSQRDSGEEYQVPGTASWSPSGVVSNDHESTLYREEGVVLSHRSRSFGRCQTEQVVPKINIEE